jgi:hypothetical protein
MVAAAQRADYRAVARRTIVAEGKRSAEPGSGRFLARSGGDAAKPTGRLVADMDPARNFGATLLGKANQRVGLIG